MGLLHVSFSSGGQGQRIDIRQFWLSLLLLPLLSFILHYCFSCHYGLATTTNSMHDNLRLFVALLSDCLSSSGETHAVCDSRI